MRPEGRWSIQRSPGSRSRNFRTCQGLRPRRVGRALAVARPAVLPSDKQTSSAPGIRTVSRLDGWPVRSPADASPASSRTRAHGSGPVWFATPSPQWTCTTYSLPVSRRTCLKLVIGESRTVDEKHIWPDQPGVNQFGDDPVLSIVVAHRDVHRDAVCTDIAAKSDFIVENVRRRGLRLLRRDAEKNAPVRRS